MAERRPVWRRLAALLVVLLVTLAAIPGEMQAQGEREAVSRRVLAVYNSAEAGQLIRSTIHSRAQMPLNHLGLAVDYHDISDEGVPGLAELEGRRGVIAWFPYSDVVDDQEAYARWLTRAARGGKKVVLLGERNIDGEDVAQPASATTREDLYNALGFQPTGSSVSVTYDTEVLKARPEMAFERPLPSPLPRYPVIEARHPDAQVYLRLGGPNRPASDLVMTTPAGGFAAPGFAVHIADGDANDDSSRRSWLVDPFRFFADAFDVEELPALDPTTRAGRRIYYSHIDGDGWLNRTQIASYKGAGQPPYSSRVIAEEIIKGYPDMPVTVGPIAAELDPAWHGTEEARAVARDILAQPQVEVGHHTYSHPLFWQFFARDDHRARERRFFASYPGRDRLLGLMDQLRVQLGLQDKAALERELPLGYDRPRSYGLEPFAVSQEIGGGIEVIEDLAPPDKEVQLYQWSGNTQPFADMIAATDRAGLPNINGGDTRFDPEYDSYIWVAPVGRPVDGRWQVYASNANENVYTEGWSERYFAFQNLKRTLENTETPRRVSAFNVYYHMYSGEREASLAALKANLDFAQERDLIPLEASTYAKIGKGFRAAKLQRDGQGRWHVADAGALTTLRFDRALDKAVDFAASRGVLGQRRLHGSLYVALDPAADEPAIALRDTRQPLPEGERPGYLIASEWDVRGLSMAGPGFSFTARGYRSGAMRWRVAPEQRYRIRIAGSGETQASFTATSDRRGELAFALGEHVPGPWPKGPVAVQVTPSGAL